MTDFMKASFCVLFLIFLCGCTTPKTDFLVLDFGSKATPKIAKILTDLNASHVVTAEHLTAAQITAINPKGIIMSGGPASVYEPGSPKAAIEIYHMGIPVLGICYGMQLMASQLGGRVGLCKKPEIALLPVTITSTSKLYAKDSKTLNVWMYHKDCVESMPDGFRSLGYTSDTPIAMFENTNKKLYGVQFHPERFDKSLEATVIIERFVTMTLREQQSQQIL